MRWDRPFLDRERFGERERLINELYSSEVAAVAQNDDFGTDGDENRSEVERFGNRQPRLGIVLERIFRPKLMRLIILATVLLGVAQVLGSVLLLAPFVLAVAALYCLAEDTQASRKLFVQIMEKLRLASPRSS